MTAPLDTSNRFLVGVEGARVLVARPPVRFLTAGEALNLALWLVVCAEAISDADDELPPFERLLEEMRA